jgi:hypothetical protein
VLHVQEEIDAFLLQQDDAEDDAQFEQEQPAAKKLKGADGSAAPAPPAGQLAIQLAPLRYAMVRQYASKTMVDIREHYEQASNPCCVARGVWACA